MHTNGKHYCKGNGHGQGSCSNVAFRRILDCSVSSTLELGPFWKKGTKDVKEVKKDNLKQKTTPAAAAPSKVAAPVRQEFGNVRSNLLKEAKMYASQ